MPDTMDEEAADKREGRPARGLQILIVLLVSIALPSAIYAIYVLGQLEQIREHNLRGLESTAQEVSQLLDNTRTTVENLRKDPAYACSFFERQNRARLITPTCKRLAEDGNLGQLHFEASRGSLDIVGNLKNGDSLRIAVQVGALLEEVPFGSVFDRLMIVDEKGKLLGSAITPQRSSPMLPPGVAAASGTSPPVRVLNLAELKFVDDTKETPIKFNELRESTLVQPVTLAGIHYTLMCQPWSIADDGDDSSTQTWRLCGLIDGQRALRQALDVAPQFIILLLILFTLAVISWPLLKVISIAPRERIRFADMFLMLLATLALVMVLSVGVADLGTYTQLRERSQSRLRSLAEQIEDHLRTEFTAMRGELRRYDLAIAGAATSDEATRVSCLLSPPKTTSTNASDGSCVRAGPLAALLNPPAKYGQFQDVFWMRPCSGQQFIKGTAFRANTPAVETGGREYFQAVQHGRLWSMSPPGPGIPMRAAPSEKFFVDTSSSITTGEFFAALSIESAVKVAGMGESANCTAEEATRVAAAMTGRPESFNHPILAPGVGFAVINETGRVLFHSDERRAVYENLFDDEGLANRLRAVLATRSDASFHAHYQTSPHQVYVHPLHDIPWAIVTFADDEILRTEHIETLAQSAVLIALYLLLAILGTLLYIFLHGREPPRWVWPCRDAKYRVLYANTVWTLCAQLILSLLALDVLRGEVLALACLLLPLPAVCTIIIAARQARRLSAPPLEGMAADIYYAKVAREFRRSVAWLLALAVGLLLGLIALMKLCYPLAAAQMDIGIATAGLVVSLVIVIAAGAIGEGLKGRSRLPLTQWWRDPLTPHIVASVIVWLVVGALPAYGLYKFVQANEMTVMTMNEHAYVERALAWRTCKVQDEYRSIPGAESTARQELVSARSSGSTDEPLYSYLSALMSRDAVVNPDQQGYEAVRDRAVGHEFWEYFASRAPVYNQTTMYSRYFEFVAPDTQSGFKWIKAGSKNAKTIAEPMLVYQHRDEGSCDPAVYSIASRPPMLEPHFGLLGTLAVLGFIPMLFGWSAFGARRLFFGDIEIETRRTGDAENDAPLVAHPGRLDLPPDMAWIKSELAAVPSLVIAEETLLALCSKCTTRRAVADAILEQACAFYAAEWQNSDDEEKLLLIQLVQEGFANPRQHEVVRRLLKRGLMRRDPVLRPMNDSFALFIENQTEPEDIRHMETVHRGMRWTLVRNVLIAAGLLVLIFLSVTQRDVIEVWAAYLGTAAAGAGGVLKLFSMLGRSGPQKSS